MALLLLFVMVLSFASLFSGSTYGQPVIQAVTLPAGTPTPWQMEHDGSRYIWFTGSWGGKGYAVRVDTQTVLVNPSASVQKWEVAPPYHALTGSAYCVSYGIALGGGYVWVGSQYSGADQWSTELLSRFNPVTLEVKHYWLAKEAKGIRAVKYGGGYVWIAAQEIWRFDVATEVFVACTSPLGVYDLLVDSGSLYATAPLPLGIVKMDMATFAYANYAPGSHPALLTRDSSGNLWFSMGRAQKIGKLDTHSSIIAEYALGIPPINPDTGEPYDGPYGLVFDGSGKLWVAGWQYRKMMCFNPATALVEQQLPVASNPYYPIQGALGSVWYWGQGSVEIGRISSGGPTTVTTTEETTATTRWETTVTTVTTTVTVSGGLPPVGPRGLGFLVPSIYRSSDPLGFMVTGNVYDDSAIGFVYAHRVNNKILFSKTDAARVQANGKPTWSGYKNLVTVGGRLANPTVAYYEDLGSMVPLRYTGNATHHIIVRTTDLQRVLCVPVSETNSKNDYFIMETVVDSGHIVVMLWGLTQWGTYASGIYFDGKFMSLNDITYNYCVVRWQDLNNNLVPDYPDEFSFASVG